MHTVCTCMSLCTCTCMFIAQGHTHMQENMCRLIDAAVFVAKIISI